MVTFGVGRTYRYFNNTAAVIASGGAQDTYIRYRFGYGLSYCTFSYGALTVIPTGAGGYTASGSVAALSGPAGGCREVVELYLTLPSQAPLVTPIYSLVGFTVLDLLPGAPGKTFSLSIPMDDLKTTAVDGSRALVPGKYTFYASGHLPDDPNPQSNVVTYKVTV